MKRFFALVIGAAIATLAAACTPQDDAAQQGPVVVGMRSGESVTSYLPFSPYTTGNPVIATEAHVVDYAVPQVGATSLAFTTALANRKIQLFPAANDNQFYGFGINSRTLRYQTSDTSADHVFFAGTSATTSAELFRVYGTGGFIAPKTSYIVSTSATSAKLQLAKYTGGSGHTDGPKWGTVETQYLTLGGLEYGAGTVRGIGFGYGAATLFAPGFIGYQEIGTPGSTNGDLFFATRPTTTNVAPTERLRITAAGDIKAVAGYTPATDTSLAPKNYVDGRSLSPAAITAIKALTPSSTVAEVIAALQKP
jgi:hypothetical protein